MENTNGQTRHAWIGLLGLISPGPPSAAETQSQPRGHLPWLDWLRFLAALAVVICHVRGGHWVEWGALKESSQSSLVMLFFAATRANLEPVTVFFVLSGFFVGGRLIERVGANSFRLREYMIDRFVRIYLPLFPALILSAAVFFFRGKDLSLTELVGNMLSLQGVCVEPFAQNVPLWSLAYEVWFYVLGGLVAITLLPAARNRTWALLGATLVFVVFTKLNPLFLLCWCIGALAFPLRRLSWGRGKGLAGCVAALAAIALSQLNMQSSSIPIHSDWIPPRDICLLLLCAALTIVVCWLCNKPPTGRWSATLEQWGTRLAAFSYTLYLTHYPLLALWEQFDDTRSAEVNLISILIFLLKIGGCLLGAWLLYLPFEAKTSTARQFLKERWIGVESV